MTYCGGLLGGTQVRVQIRSVRGETVDLAVPSGCTIGQLRSFLIQEYDYPPSTRFMYNTSVVGDDSCVEDFPYGSLVIVTPTDSRHLFYETQPQTSVDPYVVTGEQQQPLLPQETQRLFPNQQQRHNTGTRLPQHQFLRQPQQQQRQNCWNNRQQNEHQIPQTQPQPQSTQHPMQQYDRNPQSRQQGQQRVQQQQMFTDPHSTAAAMSTHTAPSRIQNNQTGSNSLHSSGSRTPRNNRGKGRQSRRDEPPRSVPRQSSPPMRSPYRSADSTLNSSGNSPACVPLPVVQNSSGENEALKAEMPRTVSAAQTHVYPSKTPGEENNNNNNGVNVNTNVSGVNNDDDRENNTTSSDQFPDPTKKPLIPLKCAIPALGKSISLELSEDATIGDLLLLAVAQEPRLAGSKIVFRGKVLSGSDVRLSSCGIHTGGPPLSVISLNPNADGVYTLFFASGDYSDLNKVMLIEIETDVSNIVSSIQDHEQEEKEIPLQLRRGYYEELMRILFRTDNLQDLDDDWRLRRKNVVKEVTHIQDVLNVANSD